MQTVLLTTSELANFLRVTPRTISKYRQLGLLPYVRLPRGKVRFDQKEVLDWLKEKTINEENQ